MNEEFYRQFLAFKAEGRKADAKTVLDKFIASFESLEEKRIWVFPFLEASEYGHRIRNEIYESLVYPVLLDGYLKRDAKSVAWLARTANNLYALRSVHPTLQNQREISLFQTAYGLEPNEEICAYLLRWLLNWFSYAQHEWPAGILYGTDGANAEQCEEILQDIAFAVEIDFENRHIDFLQQFEAKVREYIARL